nr:hypothetical protein [Tanacetum cinerariifolium]
MSLESFQAQCQAHVGGVAICEAVVEDDTSANVVRKTPSPADTETGADTDKVTSEGDTKILNMVEEQGEDVDYQGYLEEQTNVLDEGQARSDPGKALESRPQPDDNKMDEDQTGSDPIESYVALAGPNPKPMHDDFVATINQNVVANVVSMVTVPIHQASTSVPPLSTHIIDLSPPKPAASPLPKPFTDPTTVTTTTTLPLLLPL